MAFYCATMLSMALELAADDPSYEDIASKFFEHFVAIADAMNSLGGMGLWDEQDGFYYDVLNANGTTLPLRIRSMVGIIPLFAVEVLEQDVIDRLPGFKKRLEWFLKHRQDLARHITLLRLGCRRRRTAHEHVASAAGHSVARAAGARAAVRARRERSSCRRTACARCRAIITTIRIMLHVGGMEHRVDYVPGESNSGPVRRQLELARADLVSGQLSADRSAGALSPFLRRLACKSNARPAPGR